MDIHSSLLLLTSCLFSCFGVFVLLNDTKGVLNRIFFFLCFVSTVWLSSYSLAYSNVDHERALVWFKIGYVGVIFIAPIVFNYVVRFLGFKKLLKFVYLGYFLGLAWVLILFRSSLFITTVNAFSWGLYPQGGTLHKFFLVYFLALVSIAFTLLIVQLFLPTKNIGSFKRTQLSYLLLAFFVYNFASCDFLPNYGINIYPFGYIPLLLFLLLIGHTIVRYHLMDIKVAMTRAGIFLLLYTPFLGIPIYLGYRLSVYPQLWYVSLSLAIFLASLGPIIYRKLQTKADSILLSQQRRYQKILLHAAGGMVTEHNLGRLFKLIVYILKRSVGIKYAAMFGYDRDTHSYTLRCCRGLSLRSGTELSDESDLIQYLSKTDIPRMSEEMDHNLKDQVKDLMGTQADVLVPSLSEHKLLAFMVLGPKNNREPYSGEDLNVFRILSHQASLAIENCMFFDDFKTVQEELFQAEKLASIGGIADGVAHQIKNRLNHFSLAAGELKLSILDFMEKHPQVLADPELVDIFEYLKTLAESVAMNVQKTDGIVKGILNFARTSEKDTYFGFVALEDMISSAIGLLMVKHEVQDIPIIRNLNGIERIWGVKSQLNEVVYNLLDNAYESTQEKYDSLSPEEYEVFKPEISVVSQEKDGHYQITFSDNGNGIKDKNRAKMFAPFFTTKSSYKSGSGIGMYVVKRIVEENHHGKIWFESEPGKGATFHVRLPKPTPEQIKKTEEMFSPEQ